MEQAAYESAWREEGGGPAAGTETTFIGSPDQQKGTKGLQLSFSGLQQGMTHHDPGTKSGPLPVLVQPAS